LTPCKLANKDHPNMQLR